MGDIVERRKKDVEWEKKSLVEKWKDAFDGNYQSKRTAQRSYYICTFLGWYAILTQLYTSLNYLIPFDYAGYTESVIYLRNILACFMFINAIANWTCLQFYNTYHERTDDRPTREERPNVLYATIHDKLESLQHNGHHNSYTNGFVNSNSNSKNGFVAIDVGEETKEERCKPHPSLEWRYCDVCDLLQPPRCHHCNLCEKCVLKRDHHCYIVGRCIGFYNQRYFVMLNFFACLICIQIMTSTYRYLQVHHTAKTRWDYFLPLTLMSWWNGEIQGHIFIMISHYYTFSWSGLMSGGFFLGQLYFIFLGKTMFEAQKMPDLVCTGSISANFRSVFGNFWMLNFIFPAQLLYKQMGDGKIWNDLKLVPKKNKAANHTKSYKSTV